MNMEGLRLFCLVVEEGSISQAARLSFVSQPAVTKQIQQLEDFYQIQLFERKAGKLLITEAGKLLYPYAKEIISYSEKSIDAMQELKEPYQTVLHIGASHTIGEYLLPELLGEFMKQQPALRFSLSIANTPTILHKLDTNALDIALVEGVVENKELTKEKFSTDELILVVAEHHRWKERKSILIEELPEEKMIWREPDSGTRFIVENALRAHHILDRIKSALELGSYQSIKSAVEAELGVSILPKLTAKKELQLGTLHGLEIEGLEISRDLHMVQKSQRFKKQGVVDFVGFIRSLYNNDKEESSG
jgi:LysR family transcriptional regulator, transcriptional activator of the cysJI operon